MNAQGVKNDMHLEFLLNNNRYIAQVKLDGMRAIVHITRDGLRIFGRSAGVGDPSRPLEKTASLPHLAALKFPELAGTVLDCEILAPGEDSAALAGLVNRKKHSQDSKKVKIFVFDCLMLKGKKITEKPYDARFGYLLSIAYIIQSDLLTILPFASSPAQKRMLYESVLAQGGEGIMLKNVEARYIEGERPSNNWFKAKKSAAYDCVVMGFSKGKGKYNTQIGAVKFGQYVNGELIELGQASGMTDEIRQEMSCNPKKFLGKVVIIKGMERLKSGAIRHPIFVNMATDKQPKDCIWYGGEQ